MSAGGVQPSNPDPLRETTRYTKVADLSHGSFGFVQLARNTETQELVAIKFIERGDRVNRCVAWLSLASGLWAGDCGRTSSRHQSLCPADAVSRCMPYVQQPFTTASACGPSAAATWQTPTSGSVRMCLGQQVGLTA